MTSCAQALWSVTSRSAGKMEEGQFLDAGLEWQYSLCVWGVCLAQRFEVDREFGDWREGAVVMMMICLLLSVHEHIYRSGRTNTDRDGGREIRPWLGRVNTSAAIESQQRWMRLLRETLNASVARHKALLSSFRGQGVGTTERLHRDTIRSQLIQFIFSPSGLRSF